MKNNTEWKQIVKDNLSPTLLFGWLVIAAVLFGVGFWVWNVSL